MKLKTLVIGGSGLFLMVFSLLLFVAILFSDEQDSGISNIHYGGVNVSAEVLAHKPMVEKYAKEYGVEEYVNILLAIIQVESGGTAEDVMQSSESLGLPPNSLSTEESIKQGVKYFSELLASSERLSVDLESVQCLKAILDEIVVQKVTIAKEMKDLNDEGYQFLKRVFRWRKSVLPQSHSHTYQWGLAIQLWQYVLCATGNAVSCHNRV